MGSPSRSGSTVEYHSWVHCPERRSSSSRRGTLRSLVASTHSSLKRSRMTKRSSQLLAACTATREGQLVDAASGSTFDNINPADEEVLGVCADGSADDMRRAIAAARRAFDDTGWSTDHGFRRRCLEQLQAAMDKHREELRQMIVAEVGTPVLMTYAVQTDAPIDDLSFWAELADSYEYERWLDNREVFGALQRRVVLREAAGVVGAI